MYIYIYIYIYIYTESELPGSGARQHTPRASSSAPRPCPPASRVRPQVTSPSRRTGYEPFQGGEREVADVLIGKEFQFKTFWQ